MSEIYVDLDSIKEFTKEHLEIYERNNPKTRDPWLFGEDLPESLELFDIDLVDFDSVNWKDVEIGTRTQYARAGGKNPKETEIATDIRNYGFKLNVPAIAVLSLPNNGKFNPLNGRTRAGIFEKHYPHVKNFIGIIYKVKDEYVNQDGSLKPQALSDISIFGCAANAHTNPSGNTQMPDVVRELNNAIREGWIKPELKAIRKRVELLCGKGVFSDRKRDEMAYRVYNQYSPTDRILPWDASNVKLWRKQHNINDVTWSEPKEIDYTFNGKKQTFLCDGIVYHVVSSSTLSKAISSVARTAKENPSKLIRLIIHTGTLDGFDVVKCFEDRISRFRLCFESVLNDISFAYFGNVPSQFSRVKLYGCLPAIESEHDLTKIIKFVPETEENLTGMEQSS